MKSITKIDPLALPTARKPGTLPSLPEWVERLRSAVHPELQKTLDGKTFKEVQVLPREMIPNPAQRRMMEEHATDLRAYLAHTPNRGIDFETRTATAVAKILMVLAGEKKSVLSEQARSEIYLDILDETPCWAVEEAVRRWFRHECGIDERGREYDYRWAPDPGALRRIAKVVEFEFKARISQLETVLNARQYIDCSEELRRGRAASRGLKTMMARDLERAKSMSFEEAIELGGSDIIEDADQNHA